MEFSVCLAAWLAHNITKAETLSLFKEFSSEAVTEANYSTWDDTTKKMITPSEKEALVEKYPIYHG